MAASILFDGDAFLLDEPFSGIDDKLKDKVIAVFLEHTKDKLVIMVTHDKQEAQKIGAKVINVDGIPLKILN